MIDIRASQVKGRGVFARKGFKRGDVIEEAPVIILADPQWEEIEKTDLRNYYFIWDENSVAVAFGHVSLCNHSYSPNAVYKRHPDDFSVELVAIRDIEADEEITMNYNGPPDDHDPLWFEAV